MLTNLVSTSYEKVLKQTAAVITKKLHVRQQKKKNNC